jgi:hypothetical protein
LWSLEQAGRVAASRSDLWRCRRDERDAANGLADPQRLGDGRKCVRRAVGTLAQPARDAEGHGSGRAVDGQAIGADDPPRLADVASASSRPSAAGGKVLPDRARLTMTLSFRGAAMLYQQS